VIFRDSSAGSSSAESERARDSAGGGNILETYFRTRHPILNTQYPIPNTQYPIPNTQYPIPNTQYLLKKKHSLRLNKLPCLYLIIINTAWQIRRIESYFICSRGLSFIYQRFYFLTKHVIYF
jgi:hypothetical protein